VSDDRNDLLCLDLQKAEALPAESPEHGASD
jgi:hypothetical protein